MKRQETPFIIYDRSIKNLRHKLNNNEISKEEFNILRTKLRIKRFQDELEKLRNE